MHKLFPNISTLLKQIHIFKTSVTAEDSIFFLYFYYMMLPTKNLESVNSVNLFVLQM